MSPNLTESTRLGQSLTSASIGLSMDPLNSFSNSALGTSSLATNLAGNPVIPPPSNSGIGDSFFSPALGTNVAPIGPSSGMSYKAVTLSKPAPSKTVQKLVKKDEDYSISGQGLSFANHNASSNLDRPSSSDKAGLGVSSSASPATRTSGSNKGAGHASQASGQEGARTGKGSGKAAAEGSTGKHAVLSEEQLATFRTSFCAKHHQNKCPNSDSCEKSHCLTWQRRNPYEISYCPHLCPEIQFVKKSRKMVLYRRCTRGKNCNFAHSKEEELYHPLVYKTKQCSSFPKCTRYFCPFVHDPSEMRDASKFMNETYPPTANLKASKASNEGKSVDDSEETKDKSDSDAKASPGLAGVTSRHEGGSGRFEGKETYRDEYLEGRDYLFQSSYGQDYYDYPADYVADYSKYGKDYAGEYDEYNSQFAKDYPVYNKEYTDQFASEFSATTRPEMLEKADQMTQFDSVGAGLDSVATGFSGALDGNFYYQGSLEGVWPVDSYTQSVTSPRYASYSDVRAADYQSTRSGHRGSRAAPAGHNRRASYKDAYNSGAQRPDAAGVQQYKSEYRDKDYYANYPDLLTTKAVGASGNLSSLSQANVGQALATNGELSTSYCNSGDNYHSPDNSYQSSNGYQSSVYLGEGSSYLDPAGSGLLQQGSGASYLDASYLEPGASYLGESATPAYLQSYYGSGQDLGSLHYDLEQQLGSLGLNSSLSGVSNSLNAAGMESALSPALNTSLSGAMEGGIELNDMFVKIINEMEK